MRTTSIVAALALLAPAVAGVAALSPASATAPPAGEFAERWCSDGFAAPCLVSATRDTGSGPVTLTSSDPDWQVLQTGEQTDSGDQYFQWLVQPTSTSSGPQLTTGETWSLTFDTGTVAPTYTEAYAGHPQVTRTDDGDGTYHVTYAARPVLTTDGCDFDKAWPWPCSTVATAWRIELSGEVWDRSSAGPEWNGFDRSQSADGVNGIFLETAPDGSRFLSSEMVNSHQYDDGGTLETFKGEAHFRLPYLMLKNEFGVPNPETMVASSLTGTVNGSTSAGTWSVFHDPAGGAMIVEVSDLTFTVKRLKVRRGVITPTSPTQVSATRTSAHRGFVDFDPSAARGAGVTGYVGQCVPRHGDAVVTAKSANIVRFTGLRRGATYDCMVRATSKAGPSKWSRSVRMAGSPHS